LLDSLLQEMRGAGDRICCTFTTYNVLGLLFGALVVGVSAWLAVDKASFFSRLQIHNLTESDQEDFSSVSAVDYGAYILVGVGAAILLQSIIGSIGTMMGCCGNTQARCCLLTYGLLVLLVVVIEVVAAVLVLHVYHEPVERQVEQFMNVTVVRAFGPEGADPDVTVLWDHMMEQLSCCGVRGYTDFPAQVPSSCCSSNNFTCPDDPSSDLQMSTGCFSLLLAGTVPALASSLAVVGVFQLAGVLLACCLARLVATERREWYELSDH